MPTVETLYRCRICFDDHTHHGYVQDAIRDRAFILSYKEPAVSIESFEGCPAAGPYIELESSNLKAVERLAGKIERYINRRKGVTLTP